MVAKVNLDFSSSIRQIEALKSAAEAFGRVVQDAVGGASRLSGMQGQTSGVIIPGSNAELLAGVRQQMQGMEQAKADFLRRNPTAVEFEPGRFRSSPGRGGTVITDFGARRRALEQQESQLMAASANGTAFGPQQQIPSTFKSGTSLNFSTLGYSMADLPGMLASSSKIGDEKTGDLKRLSDTIKSLQTSGDRNSSIAANVLKDISKDLRLAQQEFTRALDEFHSPDASSTPEKQRAAMDKLVQTMAGLSQVMSQRDDAERGARALPGGGGGGAGGGGGPTMFGMPLPAVMRAGRIGLGFAGAGAGAFQFYQQMQLGLGQAVVGGEFNKLLAQGQMAEMRFSDTLASQDMTKVENIFKFRGDTLLGGRSRFLGPTGFPAAMGVAAAKQRMEIELQRQERDLGVLGGGISAGLGAVQMIGGAALAAVPGAGALGAGIASMGLSQMLSGGKSAISAYTQSPYSQLTGDLGTGAIGWLGSKMYGPGFANLTKEKQAYLVETLRIQQYSDARKLQDAEMQTLRPLMAGFQEKISTMDAQLEGATLVGRYAQRGFENIDRRTDIYRTQAEAFMSPQAKQQAVSARETRKHNTDLVRAVVAPHRTVQPSQVAHMPAPVISSNPIANASAQFQSGVDYYGPDKPNQRTVQPSQVAHMPEPTHDGFWKKVFSRATPESIANASAQFQSGVDYYGPDKPKPIAKKVAATISGGRSFRSNQRLAETENFSVATGFKSVHALLMMSSADFDRHANQLTNVLGRGITSTDAQTSRMIQLSRSGLGDFGALMGNVAGLNRAVGGQDNTGRLEQVLANSIAIGFDKSRTAQMFTGTVTQLAEQTGVTGIAGLSRTLGIAAMGMGIDGADERSLREAATGISQYSQYTASRGNISGLLGTIGAVQSGLGFGRGGAIATGMSSPELLDAIEQLRSGGRVTSPDVRSLQNVSGKTPEELAKSLEVIYRNKSAPIKHLLLQKGGLDIDKFIGTLNPESMDFNQNVIKAMDQAKEAGRGSTIAGGPEGVMAFVAGEIQRKARGVDVKRLIGKQIEDSPMTDPARQQMRSFLDSLTANANVISKFKEGGVSKEERELYFQSLSKGGVALDVGGKAVTRESYDKGDASFRSAADKELGNLDKLELIRNENYAAAVQNADIQRVFITNFDEMLGLMLRSQESKIDRNQME